MIMLIWPQQGTRITTQVANSPHDSFAWSALDEKVGGTGVPALGLRCFGSIASN